MKQLIHITRDVPAHWVGDGFPVRSLFSYGRDSAAVDPFLLLDFAGPHEFAPAEAPRGVGEHPHRGFETVTIVYNGELEHRDSAGHHGTIGPGDVQWMTAASGVVHEEFHSAAFTKSGGMFEVVQLWVNLPAKDKMSTPRYQEIRAGDIPRVTLPDGAGTARVIAGEFGGVRGPATTFTPLLLLDLTLKANAKFIVPVPDGHTTMIFLYQGLAKIGGTKTVESTSLARLSRDGIGVEIEWVDDRRYVDLLPDDEVPFNTPSRMLVLSGEPICEPVVGQGPFVMNTSAEIRQAIADYQSGAMGSLK